MFDSHSRRSRGLSLADWLIASAKATVVVAVLVALAAVALGQAQELTPVGGRTNDTSLALERCLADTQAAYERRWQKTCERLGQGADCLLSVDVAQMYRADRQESREACAARHRTN